MSGARGATAVQATEAAALPDDGEPTTEWAAAALGISLEDADWLMILYRFQAADPSLWQEPHGAPRRRYVCETP